jgi:hypothetical protein
VNFGVEPFYQRFIEPVDAFFAGLGVVARYHILPFGRFVPYIELSAAPGATDRGVPKFRRPGPGSTMLQLIADPVVCGRRRNKWRERRAAGPILNDLDQLEPARGHLLDYDVDGDAVATVILRDTLQYPWPKPGKHRRRVEDREHAAQTQDSQVASNPPALLR